MSNLLQMVTLQDVLTFLSASGVIGIAGRLVYQAKKDKKTNGKDSYLLNDIKGQLTVMTPKVNETYTAVQVIKNEMVANNKRCDLHMTNQGDVNRKVEKRLDDLDDRVYNLR